MADSSRFDHPTGACVLHIGDIASMRIKIRVLRTCVSSIKTGRAGVCELTRYTY